VRLVHDDEKVGGVVVEQAGGSLTLLPTGEVTRVVLDAGARPDFEHHLDIEIRSRFQPLRLEQLPGIPKQLQALGKLGTNRANGAFETRPVRDEVLGRVDAGTIQHRDFPPVSALIFEMRSISSPQSSTRTPCSS
jgi:hypothetical protein